MGQEQTSEVREEIPEHHDDDNHSQGTEAQAGGDWWSSVTQTLSEWTQNLDTAFEGHDEAHSPDIEEVSMPLVFGIPLLEVLQREKRQHPGLLVPVVVYDIIRFMSEESKLTQQGIFRVSGCRQQVLDLCALYDKGDPVTLDDAKIGVHEAASLLKKYLQTLPSSLIPIELVTPTVSQSPEELKTILESLPKEQVTLLEFIVSFLLKVIKFSEVNLMTQSNICLAFGPSIIPIPDHVRDMAQILFQTKQSIEVLNLLITHYDWLFADARKQSFPEKSATCSPPEEPETLPPPSDLPPAAPQQEPVAQQEVTAELEPEPEREAKQEPEPEHNAHQEEQQTETQ